MKKSDPDKKRLTKLRAAVRNVWQYDPLRKAIIKAATYLDSNRDKIFSCPLCKKEWPVDMATVDHEPELGSFTLTTFGDWVIRCFFGSQRAICKPCHRRKPRKAAKNVTT